jgi:RHS repeat-associated protein
VGRFQKETQEMSLSARRIASVLCTCVSLIAFVASVNGREFSLSGVTIDLEDVTSQSDVYFTSMRLNRALNVWNVELAVSNKSSQALSGPIVLLVDGFSGTSGPQQTDGTIDGAKGFFDMSGWTQGAGLGPGQTSGKRTLSLGIGGSGSPSLVTRIYAARPPEVAALALTRSLDDAGRPLPAVEMQIAGPAGSGSQHTDIHSGVSSFGQGAGAHVVKFSRDGYLPVWRRAFLSETDTRVVPNPRLTKRSPATSTATPLSETVVSNSTGSIRIVVPAGAVSQSTTISLTPLTAQNLPAFLPLGWSPLRAFWIEAASPLQTSLGASVRPAGPIGGNEAAALVRWNEAEMHWTVVQTVSGNGTNAVNLVIPGVGAYALVVGDAGELAPPPAQLNQALSGISVSAIDAGGFTATGSVTPPSSPASLVPELVTGMANVVLKHSTRRLPSGYLLRGEVTETYLLSDGSLRLTPQYEHFITGYQRPGDQDPFTLHASFPMRPVLLFGPDQLDSAAVRVDVLTETPFDGEVLDETGGQIASEGVRLLAGSGRLLAPSALRLRRLDATVFTNLVGDGHSVIAAFDLTADGSTLGDSLAIQLTAVSTNGLFVLARLLSDTGFYGLQPIERLQSDAQGNLHSLEPAAGERLPGLRGSGQFVLIQVDELQGLISGVARNGNNALQSGMPVRLTGLPWMTLTDEQGRFQLVSPVGQRDLGVMDPVTGDTGFVAVNITNPAAVLIQNLGAAAAGPRVAKISPAHNAQRVPRVGSVVIEFNEAVNPASVIGAIQLIRPDNSVVAAALSLNLANTIATLSPAVELDPNAQYRVRLASTIADPGGLPLEGQGEFLFTTVALSARDPAAQLIIYEPGATNVPADVLSQIPAYEPGDDPHAIVVRGTPGTADPEVAVILVNESSGETATVLSRPDGSFASLISGTEEDFVSATFVNLNGTRVYVPVSRQEFDNGFVGLYPQGGILEAQSDGGPVRVLIEPHAITTKAKVRIKIPTAAELARLLGDTEPEVAAMLAKPIIFEGETQPMQGPMKVSFTVDLAASGYPTNADPAEAAIALVQITDTDGIKAFEVLDQLQFTPGGAAVPGTISRVQGLERNKSHGEEAFFGVANSVIGLIPQAGIANTVFRYVLMPILVGGNPIVVKGRVLQSLEIPQLNNPFKVNDPLLQGFKFEQLGSAFKVLDQAGQVVGGVNSVNNYLTDLLEGRPLGGAFVTLQNVFTPSVPGHIRPGMVYSTSDREGYYLMVAPTTPRLELQPGDFHLVMATHPRFREKLSEKLFALQDLSIAGVAFKNFTFREPLPIQVPPTVNVAHSPPYPAAGEMVALQVNAAQGFQGNPEVNVFVEQVFPTGQKVEDVRFTNVEITTDGNRTRWSGKVVATNTIRRVMFRVSVIASGGEVKVVRYPVSFTGAPEPTNDDVIPPSDPNEEKGPAVTVSFPVEGGLLNDTGEITLIFNEPIDRRVLDDISGIVLSPETEGVAPAVRLSADQTMLTLQYAGLLPDTDYTLTVSGASVMDLSGNSLDQRPSTPEPDSFSLTFRTQPIARYTLPRMVNGSGSVIHGALLYAMDNTTPPMLRTYDVSKPNEPALLSSVPLVGTPRDLVVIPHYAYKLNLHEPTRTNNLVAVVGGDLDAIVDDLDSVIVKGQYLRIFDMADPRNPVEVASPIVSFRVSAAAAKVRWNAPHVVFQEYGQDLQQIVFVNLQELLIGWHATPAQRDTFPVGGKDGVDANGDGDFADAGDSFPVPQRRPAEFYGKKQSYSISGSTQKILDFSVSGGTLGVTLTGGFGLRQGGGVDTGNPVFPQYRTMAFNGVDVGAGSVDFASGDYPGRVTIIDGLPVENAGQLYTPIVALVSLSPDRLGRHRLVALDISLPESPTLIGDITFPSEVAGGGLRSIRLGEDGLLELTTVSSVFYLNSRLISRPAPPEGQLHPAIVGFLPDGGGRMRSVGSSPAGLHSPVEGGRNEIVQTSPRLVFVNFPLQSDIVDPRFVSREEEAMNTLLSHAQRAEYLVPARVRADHLGHASDLFPANPEMHYHVLAEVPGGAGETIKLGMESLSPAGWPLPNKGVGFPPVRAVDEPTLEALGITMRSDCDAPVRPLTAYRLSNNPGSPNYNRYLSRPFVVIYESVTHEELRQHQLTADREVMWSGARMRAFIEPTEQNNLPIGIFAARVDMPRGVIFPLASAMGTTLDVSYVMGPNPPPPGGDTRAPGTFGSVSAHSGEIRTEASDLTLPSPRMPISIERTIGGQDNYDGPFGLGWDFNYNQRITELLPQLFPQGFKMPLIGRATLEDSVVGSSKDLLFHTGAGRIVLFQWMGEELPPEYAEDPLVEELGYDDEDIVADYYLPEPGVFDLLVKFTDGKYERLTPDGMRYLYAANGRLETVIDRFPANRHEMEYEGRGWLRRIDDRSVTADRFIEFGFYRRATDSEFITGLDERSENPYLFGKICRLRDYTGRDVLFFYDDEGLLIRREGIKVGGENNGFSDRNLTHYDYENCRFVGVLVGPNKTPLLVVATQPGSSGVPVSMDASGAGGSTGTAISPSNAARTLEGLKTTATQPDGRATEFTFNKLGHPASTVVSGPGVSPAELKQEFNQHGQPTVVQYPEGRIHTMTYDSENPIFRSRGNLISMAVEAGPRGGESYTETYQYNPYYNLPEGAQVDANGFSIIYALSPDRRFISSIQHGAAGIETLDYNIHGQMTGRSDYDGIESTFSFYGATGFLDSSSRGPYETTYAYSGVAGRLGQATTIKPPRGAAVQTDYNANLQPVRVVRGEQLQRMAYDGQGRRVYHEEIVGDGKRRETTLTIDELGFVHKRHVNGIEVDGAETALVYEYKPDKLFRVGEVRHPGGSLQKFTYNALGHTTRMELESYVEDYETDRHGNVLSVKKGGDVVERVDYDGLDRPKVIATPTGTVEYQTERTYFAAGQLQTQKVTDPVFGVVRDQVVNGIDALGRVLSSTINGDLVSRMDTVVHGRLARQTTGPRQTITEQWNAAGHPTRHLDSLVNATITTDGNGNIERVLREEDDAAFESIFTYNELDQRRTAADSLGLIAEFTPRADGQNTAVKNGRNNSTTLEHSALGEVLRQRRADGMEFRFRHDEQRQINYTGDPTKGFDYDYDNLFRLTRRTQRDGAEISNNSFDARNQPTSITIPGGTITMTYDLQTRVKTSTVNFGPTTYETSTDYDALNRVRVVNYEQSGGTANTARYTYDKAGPLRSARFSEAGAEFVVGYEHRNDFARSRVIYPSGFVVNHDRDAAGRLMRIHAPVEDIVTVTEWHGNSQPRTVSYGGVLQASHRYDSRGRMTGARYQRTPGPLQAELRYQYDAANNVEMRQFLHRAGKTDNFSYDNGERLVRAQLGGLPLEGDTGISRIGYQRNYNYEATGLDYLLTAPTTTPGGVEVPFSASWNGHDAFLLPGLVNGVSRGTPDALGRVTAAQLWVRPAGGTQPVPVMATLQHNGLGQLTRIERADGVVIENFFQPGGLRYARKTTQNGVVVDHRHFVYDDAARLLEEFDRTGLQPVLMARYFYLESDAPCAADLPDSNGTFRRHYYIRDDQHSVVAVADRFGIVQERVWYDPFGQPVIEPRDDTAPVVKRVIAGAGGTLLIELSEPVSPIVFDLGPQAGIREFNSILTDLVSEPAGLTDLPEQVPGFAPSTVIVFTPEQPLAGPVNVRIRPGNLTDDQDNHVLAETLTIDVTGVPGAVYYAAAPVPATDAGTVARSPVGSPFLWHGQYFDYDTGLVYLRARFYDPFSGMFLAPDPMGYEDSVNLYAGIGNNPASLRDPTGLETIKEIYARMAKEHPNVDALIKEITTGSTAPNSAAILGEAIAGRNRPTVAPGTSLWGKIKNAPKWAGGKLITGAGTLLAGVGFSFAADGFAQGWYNPDRGEGRVQMGANAAGGTIAATGFYMNSMELLGFGAKSGRAMWGMRSLAGLEGGTTALTGALSTSTAAAFIVPIVTTLIVSESARVINDAAHGKRVYTQLPDRAYEGGLQGLIWGGMSFKDAWQAEKDVWTRDAVHDRERWLNSVRAGTFTTSEYEEEKRQLRQAQGGWRNATVYSNDGW